MGRWDRGAGVGVEWRTEQCLQHTRLVKLLDSDQMGLNFAWLNTQNHHVSNIRLTHKDIQNVCFPAQNWRVDSHVNTLLLQPLSSSNAVASRSPARKGSHQHPSPLAGLWSPWFTTALANRQLTSLCNSPSSNKRRS